MTLLPTRSRAALVLAIATAVLAIFTWLNLRVPAAGIVQDALLDQQNAYYLAQKQVDRIGGLRQGDPMSFVLSFPQGLDEQGMAQLIRMTRELRQRFPQAVVWSLAADSYAYRADAGELASTPHLDPAWLRPDGQLQMPVPMAQWRAQVAADPTASGLLVGKDFRYAQILLFTPEQTNELDLVRQVAEYLEQRPIHALEWLLLKGDIKPASPYANVSLGGWSVGRGLMHFALMSDVLFYSTIGLVIATLAALLALKSLKQALYSSTCIFASFVLVRGTVALCGLLGLDFFGAPLAERVYFLLVLSAMIVAGISFNTRALERYNELQARQPGAAPAALWRQVGRHSLPLNVAALVAILNFATLPQIGIRGIMEVGVLSAIGIVYQRVLVSMLLPALHITFGGTPGAVNTGHASLAQRQWERMIHALPRACHRLIVRLDRSAPGRAAMASLLACAVTVGGAMAVVVHDWLADEKWIVVQEKPIDYLPNTIVDRGRALLNSTGHTGFGRLSYLVVPAAQYAGAAVERPEFLQRAWELQRKLAALPEARGANSVLDTLAYMQQQEAGGAGRDAMPGTIQQAHDRLQQIRWDLTQPALARYLWADAGVALYLSHPADNSTSLRVFAAHAEAVAARDFPDLRMLPYGPLHSYHQTDLYISQGKPLNVLLSFPLVIVSCALWLGWLARRAPRLAALRPWATACAMTVPFLFAYAAIVLLMAAFHIPLDQATACATALGINAAIDFDLYLIDDYRAALEQGLDRNQALQRALAERGYITLTDAALNGICFSFLMLSPFLPIQRLGVIMLVMLATCALGAILLMPALLPLCSRAPRAQASQPQPQLMEQHE
ncbi:MMPL family transporter [Duganella sp. FT92W]|uniref:MMPL family transporter n=1 Tax=Pseudoduganella rivuli TaxID=2666085 RepID=A0A7X2INW4_9BURK|nr:MMPL family transporter [Pseudoduganella rivuli]MRV73314.1 MMPL family transporter [Pseudoduganella rivuli]